MFKKAQFLTPVVTAFDKKGNLDIQANKNIYDNLINNGIDGLVIMGSTGEFFAMSTEQKKELIDLSVNYVNKRAKVYIGTSCMSVEDTVTLSNYALEAGADAVMIVSPYYFALSDDSLEYYYDEVAKNVNGDIYLYNYPQRTTHDLSAEVTLNLLRKNKNIVGFKDTVLDFGHTRKLIQTVRSEFPDFEILCGFEEHTSHNILSGGDGCIGGLSNLFPDLFSGWVKTINEQNFEKMGKYQRIVDRLTALYDIGNPFIPILKKAMILRGQVEMKDYCVKPFILADEKQTEEIKLVVNDVEKMLKDLQDASFV